MALAITWADWRLWLCADGRTWRLALAWRAGGARMASGTIGVFGFFFLEAQNANRPIASVRQGANEGR